MRKPAKGIQPTGEYVLIEIIPYGSPYNEQKGHAIVLPDQYQVGPWDYAHRGQIISVGPRVTLAQVGQYVLYPKFGFAKVHFQGKDYAMVYQHDLLATSETLPSW